MALISRNASRLHIERLLASTNVATSRSFSARVGSAKPSPNGSPEPNASRKKASEKPVPKFRSKHYSPSAPQEPSANGKILLEPHVLSARLKKLCDDGKIETAVAMLKNSPLDAQNVPVWNTLIWECLKAERFRLGHDLYIDMKRRGHRPNSRTFQTLLNGLSRIESWDSHPKQLAHAHSVYQAFQRHVESVKKHDSSSAELTISPVSSYIRILGAAGLHQEIFDVFYGLDTEGPLAPDQFLFTAMFQALAAKPNPESGDFIQNAASAKLLWNLMLKATRRTNFPVDAFVVSSAIVALSRGRAEDQEFAFKLVAEHFGLVGPDDTPALKKPEGSYLQLQSQSFASILILCQHSSRPLHAIHFFAAVLDRPESRRGTSIIDRGHVEHVLQSMLAAKMPAASEKALELVEWMLSQAIQSPSSAADKIRPNYSTFNILISYICTTENDWRVATRAFDLMTGFHCHDFMDGGDGRKPRRDHRSPGASFSPTPQVLSSMVRIALGTSNRANIRQALRLIHHCQPWTDTSINRALPESKKKVKDRRFYELKLAQAVLEGVEILTTQSKGHDMPRDEDLKRWQSLQSEARRTLESSSDELVHTAQAKRSKGRKTYSERKVHYH